jgi:hypothetical protein
LKRRQRGGAIGTLIVLVALAFIGYWVYNNVLFPPQQQTGCKAERDTCIKYCRKTTAHGSPESETCLKSCEEQAQACR